MHHDVFEDVRIEGHLIDSGIMSQVMDHIIARGGEFETLSFEVGRTNEDVSVAVIRVRAETRDLLEEILLAVQEHGAVACQPSDAAFARSPARRRVPRRLLLDHQPGDRRPHLRHVGPRRQSRDGPGRARRPAGGHRRGDPHGRRARRRAVRDRPQRHPSAPARAPSREPVVRVHVECGLFREAQGAGGCRDRAHDARHARRGQGSHRGRGSGGGAHRGARVHRAARRDGLRERAVRRQCGRGARHRGSDVRHLAGRLACRGRTRCAAATSTICAPSTWCAATARSRRPSRPATSPTG